MTLGERRLGLRIRSINGFKSAAVGMDSESDVELAVVGGRAKSEDDVGREGRDAFDISPIA